MKESAPWLKKDKFVLLVLLLRNERIRYTSNYYVAHRYSGGTGIN